MIRKQLLIILAVGGLGQNSEEIQSAMETARDSGDFPGGGIGGIGGAEMDLELLATDIAERGGMRGTGFGITTTLLNGIIELLEKRCTNTIPEGIRVFKYSH